ncbi:MAG: hypothetical protein IJH86_07880 [Clostridia bacterium]|nr:hypothetical protein [Clostridia bacterium]
MSAISAASSTAQAAPGIFHRFARFMMTITFRLLYKSSDGGNVSFPHIHPTILCLIFPFIARGKCPSRDISEGFVAYASQKNNRQ